MNTTDLLSHIKNEAVKIDQTMQGDLAAITSPLLSEVIHHAIFNGGKRIRPFLTVMSSHLGYIKPVNIYSLAITFEYLHGASLLHDDIIDNADQRRGHPTANAIWPVTPVILAGDYLHSRAMFLTGTEGSVDILKITGRATAAMVEAEFLQMQMAQNVNISEEDYFKILQGKTSSLIAAACESGIRHAQGSKKQCAAMRVYGTKLGLAFQIADDLLDYLGDPHKTGKIIGNDFQEGKITLPLIYTLHQATTADHNFLINLLAGNSRQRLEKVITVCNMIKTYGGFNYSAEKAKELINSALAKLEIFKNSFAKQILTSLAHYVLTRSK